MTTMQRSRGRSLFWPLVLIGVGLVWLLSNLGVLQPASIGVLFRLWPLVLIIIGLDLLFGRQSPAIGTLIGVGGVALIIVLMLIGPSLGWVSAADVKDASYSEPVGEATSAVVNLDLSVASTDVRAISNSNNLFEADLRYVGDVNFNVSGQAEKTVTLKQPEQSNVSFNFWDWGLFNPDQNLHWNIGLSPNVPIALQVHSGVSSSILDLSDLQLTGLNVSSGVGSLTLTLPAMDTAYDVQINGGTGSSDIKVGEGAAINFNINGGVGSVTIDVPDGAAVHVVASTGVGGIDVPSNYKRISGSDDNFVGDKGEWESPNYAESDRQINIEFEGGVGSFSLH